MERDAAKALLERLFQIGLSAASPELRLAPYLDALPGGALTVLAAGKAAVGMAQAVERRWSGPLKGLVVTRHGEGRPIPRLEVIEAAHPTPDASSLAAAQRILAIADAAGEGDQLLMMLSGGASSLLCLPGDGLTLQSKQSLTRALLRSGARVEEINTVRRHLSAIKGGRLAAAAYPARLTTLVISDVVGDAAEAIGSGPTAPDPTTLFDAKAILSHYGLADPGQGWSESLKPGHPAFDHTAFHVVASSRHSLDAIRTAAIVEGFAPVSLGDDLEGEARRFGAAHAKIAREHLAAGRPVALISGGELTVTVTGDGRGGPNFEYAAALALGLSDVIGVAALAGDSDGIDGNSGASGAFVFGDTAARAQKAGLALNTALERHDTSSAFGRIGDVFAPGPTGANLNDLRIILISDRQI